MADVEAVRQPEWSDLSLGAWQPEWSNEPPVAWTCVTHVPPPLFEHERLEAPEQMLAFCEEDVSQCVGLLGAGTLKTGSGEDHMGRINGIPLLPAGCEPGESVSGQVIIAEALSRLTSGNLLSTPPGFERGLKLSHGELLSGAAATPSPVAEERLAASTSSQVCAAADPLPAGATPPEAAAVTGAATAEGGSELQKPPPCAGSGPATQSAPSCAAAPVATARWAELDETDVSTHHARVPSPAISYPFELDAFQKRAVARLEESENVFVSAHTSAGKTVVAEYAIALAMRNCTRAIYTSPVKALSNQKFREFSEKFDDVGILTGDVSINPDAACLIVTTEILRMMLYRGADVVRDAEWVIFDEVHYINDPERGIVWEEVIITLPEHVGIVCLSATVPNHMECAEWIGRTREEKMFVVATSQRPTPLRHFVYAADDIWQVVDERGVFRHDVYAQALQAHKRQGGGAKGGAKGGGRGAAGGKGGGGRGGKGGGDTGAVDWPAKVRLLHSRDLLPAVVFSFSKLKCEDAAAQLLPATLRERGVEPVPSLISAAEVTRVEDFFESCLWQMRPEDRRLPQLERTRALLQLGVGVHHAGQLPIVKELVEMLFSRGLVKVLFATETFAMGVNMPARCVLFNGVRKSDGTQFRELTTGEYTQMSGRAGRRGIDSHGVCIVSGDIANGEDLPEVEKLRRIIVGEPTKLSSKFCTTYSMLLNLLRLEATRVDQMIGRSFLEHRTVATTAGLHAAHAHLRTELSACPELAALCEAAGGGAAGACGGGVAEAPAGAETADAAAAAAPAPAPAARCTELELAQFSELMREATELSGALSEAALSQPGGGVSRLLCPGRVLLLGRLDPSEPRPQLGVLLKIDCGGGGGGQSREVLLHCLVERPRADGETPPWVRGAPLVSAAERFSPAPVAAASGEGFGHRWELLPLRPAHLLALTREQLSPKTLPTHPPAAGCAQCTACCVQLSAISKRAPLPLLDESLSADHAPLHARLGELRRQLGAHRCASLPQLPKLICALEKRRHLEEQLGKLEHALSAEHLRTRADAEARIGVLVQLGYISKDRQLRLKGRVACELRTARDELVLNELVFRKLLGPLDVAEAAALLSAFVSKGQSPTQLQLSAPLMAAKATLKALTAELTELQVAAAIPLAKKDPARYPDYVLNWAMAEAVYQWALGEPFAKICSLTTLLEGDLLRNIVRLGELCGELRSAARVMGDSLLYQKMSGVHSAIMRGIVDTPSLYVHGHASAATSEE